MMPPTHPIEDLIFARLEALPASTVLPVETRDAVREGLESAARDGSLADALSTLVLIGAFLEERGDVALAHGLYDVGDAAAKLHLGARAPLESTDEEGRVRARRYGLFTDAGSSAVRAPAFGEAAPADTTKAGALPFARRIR